LGVDKELAEGSFGSVYSVTNPHCISGAGQEYVYKEYKSYANPNADSLATFTDFYHGLGTGDKSYLDSICCWPHELVKDKNDGGVSGFLMVQIPLRFYCPISFSTGTKVVEAKFEHLLMPDRLLARRQIPLTNKARYKLLLSVVRGLNFFHEHDICVGDFSHSNILFSLGDCSVFFLDCDSFSLDSKMVFPQTETGNWSVTERYPEEALGTPAADVYKLGLLALRLLMKSDSAAHYQASANTSRLPAQVDAGVRTVIEDSLKDAANRPPLAAWSSALRTAIVHCESKPVAERAAADSSTRDTAAGGTPASGVFNVFPVSAASQTTPASAPSSSPPQQSQSQQKHKSNTNPPAKQAPYPHEEPEEKEDSGPELVPFLFAGGLVIAFILFMAATHSCSTNVGNSSQQRPAASQTQSTASAANSSASNPVAANDQVEPPSTERIEFGTWNGEPIAWRVLAVEDDRALLISAYLLEDRRYNEQGGDITWETCTLRQYLNGEFLQANFSADEQTRITTVVNQNNDNPVYGTDGGNPTEDRVFLLSFDEAAKYFTEDSDRIADKLQGEHSWWWLRSPGATVHHAADIMSSGELNANGTGLGDGNDSYSNGVRPALWLNLTANDQVILPTDFNIAAVNDQADLPSIEHIEFGTWDGKPITWRVLAAENGRMLLISEHVLEDRSYNEQRSEATWETCALRQYLNGEFLASFSANEQSRIATVTNQNPDNPKEGTSGGNPTEDRVFLLSIDEAEKYFANASDRIASDLQGNSSWWRLRSPGISAYFAVSVRNTSNSDWNYAHVTNQDLVGVRPALWLNL
jgi:serine/threonine protein kinase